jgi:DNA-binding CsgD family transcriptional regulator
VLRGQVAFASGRIGEAAELLLRGARRFEPFDLQVARQTYLTALGMASVAAHHIAGAGVLREICSAVRGLPAPEGAPRPLELLLDGLATLNDQGRAEAAPTLQRAAKVLVDISLQDTLHWGWVATGASVAMWDDAAYLAITTRMVQLLRNAGALAELPLYLGQLARARAWIGDIAGAASLIAEGDSVAAATGSSFPPYSLLSLRALQGREAEVTATIASAIERADRGAEGMASHALLAAAVLYNGLGRHEEAASAARRVAANTLEPWYSMWALPELVEAAARGGDPELARDALQRLAETTQPCVSDFARGLEARCRALVSDDDATEQLYREALGHLSHTQLKPELARTHLLFGEWLCLQGRRADAREQLRTAYDVFLATGMDAFAERARRELIAAGVTVRRRTVEARDELSPQEQQIARLACDGLTNSEIGSQLFLSARTVEWHLHRVFVKLGVDSRGALHAALSKHAGRHDG